MTMTKEVCDNFSEEEKNQGYFYFKEIKSKKKKKSFDFVKFQKVINAEVL